MKKQFDYTNKCGSCKYFCFCTKKDEVIRYGFCEKPNRLEEVKHYKEAARKACKQYEVGT